MKKEYIGIVGGLIAVSAILLFGVQSIQSDTKQNAVTWTLWFVLDVVIAVSSYLADKKKKHTTDEKVNIPWLSIAFSFGAFFMVVALVFHGVWKIEWVEMVSIVGIILALVVWKSVGASASVLVSVIAMTIASAPALYDAVQSPAPSTAWFWGMIAISGVLTLVATERWTIEQRLFPVQTLMFNASMMIIVLS